MNRETCKTCGEEIWLTFGEELNKTLSDSQHCFNCNLWEEKLEEIKTDNKYFVAKGSLYWDAGLRSPSSMGTRGFGGSIFYIKHNDGRRVKTDNLWHGGEISLFWVDRFPNTAVFLRNEKELEGE
jgi:hypothetical protein